MQYANRYAIYTATSNGNNTYRDIKYKPLFLDLYAAEGALYWLADGYVLDLNYANFDFAYGQETEAGLGVVWTTNADPSGSDAIHIRLVHDK